MGTMEGTVIHPTTTPNGPNPEILEEVNRQRKKDIASLIPLLVGFSQRKTYPTQKEIASQVFAEVGLPRKEIANLVPLRFWTIASTIPQDLNEIVIPKMKLQTPPPHAFEQVIPQRGNRRKDSPRSIWRRLFFEQGHRKVTLARSNPCPAPLPIQRPLHADDNDNKQQQQASQATRSVGAQRKSARQPIQATSASACKMGCWKATRPNLL